MVTSQGPRDSTVSRTFALHENSPSLISCILCRPWALPGGIPEYRSRVLRVTGYIPLPKLNKPNQKNGYILRGDVCKSASFDLSSLCNFCKLSPSLILWGVVTSTRTEALLQVMLGGPNRIPGIDFNEASHWQVKRIYTIYCFISLFHHKLFTRRLEFSIFYILSVLLVLGVEPLSGATAEFHNWNSVSQ